MVILIISALVTIGDLRSIDRGNWQYLNDLRKAIGKVSYDLVEDKEYRRESAKREERENLSAQLPKNGELFEEDMVMDDRLREIVLDGVEGRKRSAAVHRKLRWEFDIDLQGVIIPYTIDDNFLHRSLLEEAMQQYHVRTCIRFRPRDGEKGYVHFNSDKNTCSSNVGRVGIKQNVTIGANCNVIGTVLHEMEHVLAVIHEHSRPDRDDYVDVKWENIKKKDESNFKKYKTSQVRWKDVPYNFNSVMHYRNDAFTNNGKVTLEAVGNPDMNFGQRHQWSKGDVLTINKLYCIHDDVQHDYTPYNAEIYKGLLHDTSGLERKDRAAESYYYDYGHQSRNNEERARIIPAWK